MGYWITFNEPWCSSHLGYGNGAHAPGITNTGTDDYTAGHNLLRAHARAYRLYESTYKPTQQAKVGITLNVAWSEPENNDPANVAAALRGLEFSVGWFAHAIFGEGDYPAVMIDQVRSIQLTSNGSLYDRKVSCSRSAARVKFRVYPSRVCQCSLKRRRFNSRV